MGRYYSTGTGRGGKFGFACQSSTDPHDYFGMSEAEPTTIVYEASESDRVRIEEKLDAIYDLAQVPKDKRVYRLNGTDNEYEDYDKAYHDYFFEPNEKGGFGRITASGEHISEGEKFEGAHLAMSRLWLGLTILTDIAEEGYCNLEAEL